MAKKVDLSTQIAGIKLKNPVMNASGTLSLENSELLDFSLLGAVVTKGITLEPRSGNKAPRLAETPIGLINSIGLENPGIKDFLDKYLPVWLSFGVPVIVNISGATPSEYRQLAKALTGTGITAVEVNVSCPNIEGKIIGTDPYQTALITATVKKYTDVPVIVKLTPNTNEIAAIAQSAAEAGADAISAVNTFMAMAIDIKTQQPKIGRGFGGLSGPAIRPQALFKVWQICQAVKIPVIGMGGITCAQDAIEFFLVGAAAIAVGTANFKNPLIMIEIIQGIEEYLRQRGQQSLQEIIGKTEIS